MPGEGRALGPIDYGDIPNEINTETFNKLQMPHGRMVLDLNPESVRRSLGVWCSTVLP